MKPWQLIFRLSRKRIRLCREKERWKRMRRPWKWLDFRKWFSFSYRQLRKHIRQKLQESESKNISLQLCSRLEVLPKHSFRKKDQRAVSKVESFWWIGCCCLWNKWQEILDRKEAGKQSCYPCCCRKRLLRQSWNWFDRLWFGYHPMDSQQLLKQFDFLFFFFFWVLCFVSFFCFLYSLILIARIILLLLSATRRKSVVLESPRSKV